MVSARLQVPVPSWPRGWLSFLGRNHFCTCCQRWYSPGTPLLAVMLARKTRAPNPNPNRPSRPGAEGLEVNTEHEGCEASAKHRTRQLPQVVFVVVLPSPLPPTPPPKRCSLWADSQAHRSLGDWLVSDRTRVLLARLVSYYLNPHLVPISFCVCVHI